jgi:hypothetical protein
LLACLPSKSYEKVLVKFDGYIFFSTDMDGPYVALLGKKDDINVQQKLLSVTKRLRSETLLRREMEGHCKKVQNEKLVSNK